MPTTYRYTPDDWPVALEADLYLPRDVVRPAVVLVIHGGGWINGSPREGYVRAICRRLTRGGLAALAVSYRLAPAHRFPAQLDDLAQVLRWLQQNGPGLGLETSQVAVWGYSAGAHLASLLPARDSALPVAAVVAGGTPADLRVWPDSPYVLALLGKTRDEDPASWDRASPVLNITPSTPPHFLYHGRLDALVAHEQTLMLEAALKAADVAVTRVTRPLYGHILTAILPGRSHARAIAFLKARLLPDAAATRSAARLP